MLPLIGLAGKLQEADMKGSEFSDSLPHSLPYHPGFYCPPPQPIGR